MEESRFPSVVRVAGFVGGVGEEKACEGAEGCVGRRGRESSRIPFSELTAGQWWTGGGPRWAAARCAELLLCSALNAEWGLNRLGKIP